MADQISPVKGRKAIWRRTWSSYDIMSGDNKDSETTDFPERGNFLYNTIRSKRTALQHLRTCRREYPEAYLVKVVRNRSQD